MVNKLHQELQAIKITILYLQGSREIIAPFIISMKALTHQIFSKC